MRHPVNKKASARKFENRSSKTDRLNRFMPLRGGIRL